MWGHRAHTPHARRVCSIARYVYRCTVPTGLHSSQAGYWGYQDHALRAERDSKMGSVLTFCPRADCISFGRFSRHSKQTHGGATAQSTGCHPHVRRNPHRKIVRMHCEPHGPIPRTVHEERTAARTDWPQTGGGRVSTGSAKASGTSGPKSTGTGLITALKDLTFESDRPSWLLPSSPLPLN